MAMVMSRHERHENDAALAVVEAMRMRLHEALRGKDAVCDLALACLIARGHLLIEDAPGLGKTTLAKALAGLAGGRFARVQCTPDLLPTDVTGFTLYNQQAREFEFRAGPVFSDVLLADEINRATPRTQSALLEAMAERQVTIDNTSHPLAPAFFVVATQNPLEHLGTYPLPEAQRDRFLFNVVVGYPSREEEGEIIDRTTSTISAKPMPVVSGAEIIEYQQTVRLVPLPEHVKNFVLDLVRSEPSLSRTSMDAERNAALKGLDTGAMDG